MTVFRRCGVVGFGQMGAGIAQVIASAGFPVTVLDVDSSRLADGHRRMREMLDGGLARGKITVDARDRTVELVTETTDSAALGEADLLVEAVTEDMELKARLLTDVANRLSPHAVIATNTSALSVTEIAARLPNPGRVAGLHFFNPAPVMELVEVVRGIQTEDDVVANLLKFGAAIGKTPIEVRDRPGFLVNALLMPYLNDVIQAYDDGLASAADIDRAIQLGLGYPKGPLSLLDLIGLDVHQHATENAYLETLDSTFAPPPLLRRMVAAGRLGDKAGTGFLAGSADSEGDDDDRL